jgi:hypothetical protein
VCQARIFWPGHQDKRIRDAIVRDQTQKGRLLQLRGKPLPKCSIENRITRCVGEIG